MRSGAYRHRIDLQVNNKTRTANGGFKDKWEDFAIGVPAECLTGGGREPDAANSKRSEADLRVNFRWFEGVNSQLRLVWNGVIYDITSIDLDATARRECRLTCKTGLNQGA